MGRSRMASAQWRQGTQEKSKSMSWLTPASPLLFQVGMEGAIRDDSRTHHKQTLTNKKGNCICLLKQDLSTETPQLKGQIISISIERQKSACSTPQGRTEVRPQRFVTEQSSHLLSFHLFLNHTEKSLTQRAIQVHSQHLALEDWKHLNKVKCTGVPVPLPFALEPETPPGELHHSPSAHGSGSHHRGCF